MKRRVLLKTSLATVAVLAVQSPFTLLAEESQSLLASYPFRQPPLPYPLFALEPVISQATVELHYGKHQTAYFNKLNELVKGTDMESLSLVQIVRSTAAREEHRELFNNAGQALNHALYWESFYARAKGQPEGDLDFMIHQSFGDVEQMKVLMVDAAASHFGSGWVWLVQTGDELQIVTTTNGDNPVAHGHVPLLGIDLWEHAYYLDYKNQKAEHVKAVLNELVDWKVVGRRLV